MLEEMIGQVVVVDMKSPFVCLGKLARVDGQFLEVMDADLHDLRDTQTTRENYVVACKRTGIKHNRKKLLVVRTEIIAISKFKDVIDE